VNIPARPAISVIIPTLNEAVNLNRLLPRLQSMTPGEIIVCDGGSTDHTRDVAQHYGARVIVAERNRGRQLNAGATVARGEILWFLHADAWPHREGVVCLRAALRESRIIGGNFRLKFASDLAAARVFEIIARGQRWGGIYYGDSGIWLRRDDFEELGGFRDWPLFEDYDFARRLEHLARQTQRHTKYLHCPLTVSARRFGRKPWSLLGMWLHLQLLFWLGVPPEKLSRLYRKT
jgi:rSAM/selenodomain-associated transferase 2